MTTRFSNFIGFIFKWECVRDKHGNVITENDPSDPGGKTRWGLDQASHPNLDIDSLTEETATAVYFAEWQKEGCETLAKGLGEVYFNACVNCGQSRANRIMEACHNSAGQFLDQQEAFYRRLVAARPSLKKFLKGWLNRTGDLRKWVNSH